MRGRFPCHARSGEEPSLVYLGYLWTQASSTLLPGTLGLKQFEAAQIFTDDWCEMTEEFHVQELGTTVASVATFYFGQKTRPLIPPFLFETIDYLPEAE